MDSDVLLLSYLDKIRLIVIGEAGQALACLYSEVRESAHKSRAARSNATLVACMQRDQHHLGDEGDLQRGLGEVSCCGLFRAKQ